MTKYLLPLVVACAACGDDGVSIGNENEVITTVMLQFTPLAGGNPVAYEVDDPDGDGGEPPTAATILVDPGMYTVAVRFQNRLEDPPEEITDEVRDEAVEHQIFFTGDGIASPASTAAVPTLTQAYADTDANGNPIGLANTFTAASGSGALIVTLRHMPPLNDTPTKTGDVAAQVKAGGFSSIGGENDAQVTFQVAVPVID